MPAFMKSTLSSLIGRFSQSVFWFVANLMRLFYTEQEWSVRLGKEQGCSTFNVPVWTEHFSPSPPYIGETGLAVSHRARVQRGESVTARCASTLGIARPPL